MYQISSTGGSAKSQRGKAFHSRIFRVLIIWMTFLAATKQLGFSYTKQRLSAQNDNIGNLAIHAHTQ